MTNTLLPPRNSDRGFALILAVSVVGLACVLTVGAFLVAASLSQNTGRVASAKVDIALREDLLMREILQQTATGIAPGANGSPLNWTAIMTSAVTNARAVAYVDPAELSVLGVPSGAIRANFADTGAAPLTLFQGYSQEVPFGGTSGLANLLPSYNAAVQPPLMNWSAGSVLSPATALTTPQEFFLGSLYASTGPGVALVSSGIKRWGQLTFPNIRFGYKRPGDLFLARRVWWRIPVNYQTAQTIVQAQAHINPYPSAPSNYVLSMFEVPTQLPISANSNIQIGQNADSSQWGSNVTINGSIYGGTVQVAGGTYNNDISSRTQVNVLQSATVGGVTFADNTYSNAGVREQRDLSRAIGTGTAPVSVVGDAGKVIFVPVMPGNDFFMAAPGNAPTHWDLYARPYYKCRIRILVSSVTGSSAPLDTTLIYSPNRNPQIMGTGPADSKNDPTAGQISVNVNYLPDTGTPATPDAVLGITDTAPGWTRMTYSQANLNDTAGTWTTSQQNFLTYTSTGTGIATQDCNILQIDIGKLIAKLGLSAPQVYSIYIGYNPTQLPDAGTSSTPPALGISITGASDLHTFTQGLSIISKHRLYLMGDFNQMPTPATAPPTSLYAPDVRYGISGVASQVAITGQVSVDSALSSNRTAALSAVNPLAFSSGNGTSIPVNSANNTFSLSELTLPAQLPPITRLNLLFTIEKERTN